MEKGNFEAWSHTITISKHRMILPPALNASFPHHSPQIDPSDRHFGIRCMIRMKILFHVWNLILFKGQKYHQGSLLILFLYRKTSVQNSFVQCPIVFLRDLWPDLWPVACNMWPDLWPVTCTLAPPLFTAKKDIIVKVKWFSISLVTI